MKQLPKLILLALSIGSAEQLRAQSLSCAGTPAYSLIDCTELPEADDHHTRQLNTGAWMLAGSSVSLAVFNIVQNPLGRHRRIGLVGVGLGLAATAYGKITLENGAAGRDIAMGTMTVGILSTALSAISLLPRTDDGATGRLRLAPAVTVDERRPSLGMSGRIRF